MSPGDLCERVDNEGRHLEGRPSAGPLLRRKILPADERNRLARGKPCLAQHVFEVWESCAVLAHEAHRLGHHDLDAGQARQRCVALTFVARHQDTAAIAAKQEQRLLEARLEAREKGDVGQVLAIGIDDEPVAAGTGIGFICPRRVDRRRNGRPPQGDTKIGKRDGPQIDFHRASSFSRGKSWRPSAKSCQARCNLRMIRADVRRGVISRPEISSWGIVRGEDARGCCHVDGRGNEWRARPRRAGSGAEGEADCRRRSKASSLRRLPMSLPSLAFRARSHRGRFPRRRVRSRPRSGPSCCKPPANSTTVPTCSRAA